MECVGGGLLVAAGAAEASHRDSYVLFSLVGRTFLPKSCMVRILFVHFVVYSLTSTFIFVLSFTSSRTAHLILWTTRYGERCSFRPMAKTKVLAHRILCMVNCVLICARGVPRGFGYCW